MCQVGVCTREARWSPVIVMRCAREHEPLPPLKASVERAVCEDCRRNLGPVDLVSDEWYEEVAKALRGVTRIPIDRARTTIEWEDLSTREAHFAAVTSLLRKAGRLPPDVQT